MRGICAFCEQWIIDSLTRLTRRSRDLDRRSLADIQRSCQVTQCWFCTHILSRPLGGGPLQGVNLVVADHLGRYELDFVAEKEHAYASSDYMPMIRDITTAVTQSSGNQRFVDRLEKFYAYASINPKDALHYILYANGVEGTPNVYSLMQYPDPYLLMIDRTGTDGSALNIMRREQLRAWVSQCVCEDALTFESRSFVPPGPFVPKRLLQVQAGSDTVVRLVETTKEHMTAQYATLSHIWGQALFVTLKQANIKQYQDCVPSEDLTLTFRQAIAVCAELGIEYLWIDSLCIIQDSDLGRDWLEHAPVMHLVYQHSILNIAACSSNDPSHGLYGKFDPDFCKDLVVDVLDEYHDSIFRYKHHPVHACSNWEGLPLFHRSWCVQELCLAPRVLYFAERHLYWRCQCSSHAETGSFVPEVLNESIWDIRPKNLDSYWLKLSRDYSATALTYKSDRIPALAGLATVFAARYKDAGRTTRYIVGCWEHLLRRMMVWHRAERLPNDSSFTTFSTPTSPIPSWSWLTSGIKVTFPFFTGTSISRRMRWDPVLFQVTQADITLVDTTFIHGPISAFDFRIRAPVCSIDLRRYPNQDIHVDETGFSWKPFLNGGCLVSKSGRRFQPPKYREIIVGAVHDDEQKYGEVRFYNDEPVTYEALRSTLASCLCAFLGVVRFRGDIKVFALVLASADQSRWLGATKCHRRLGLLEIQFSCRLCHRDDWVATLEEFLGRPEELNLV